MKCADEGANKGGLCPALSTLSRQRERGFTGHNGTLMHRFKLILEYDGGPFVGWQRQENGLSVQEHLETAIHGFSGETVTTFAAGRTDAGVHAFGQVAHFDLEKDISALKVREALNHHLKPLPVAVLQVEETDTAFHARFNARERHYIYRIVNRRAPLTIDSGHAWAVARPLDETAMDEAARHLVGKHDFTTFRAAGCQSDSPVKSMNAAHVERAGEDIRIFVSARSFLYNQVRSIAGSLKLVGEGKWAPEDFKAALDAADRAACGPVAPPHGLYFARVDYDE